MTCDGLYADGSEWVTIQTLEQTNCGGNGVDVTSWRDTMYLVVVCSDTNTAIVFRQTATQGRFAILQILSHEVRFTQKH